MTLIDIKIAIRRLIKHPIFSGINGVGLTLGLIVFLFIVEYVTYEKSFNSMYDAADRTFRLLEGSEGNELIPYTVPGVVPQAKEKVPGVELATRYVPSIGNGIVLIADLTNQKNSRSFREDHLAFVDHDFLEIFHRPVLSGQPNLTQPNSVVLTKSKALQYFGTTQISDLTIKLINQFGEHEFLITGVIDDFPPNSDIDPDVLFSVATFASEQYVGYNTWANMDGLGSNFVWTFYRLSNLEVGENLIALHKQLTLEHRSSLKMDVALQPVREMHLGTSAGSELPTFGNPRQVRFLSLLAILILLIAWINYINLSTAQSMQMTKSLSVRKVIGASRMHLIKQQLAETFLLTTLSLLLAIVCCISLQPLFNRLVDTDLDLSILARQDLIFALFLFLSITTLIAGSYVAVVLTGFRPASVLKGNYSTSSTGVIVRKLLVTLQFIISIAFIAGTIIMSQQIKFMESQDVGLSLNQRLAILGPSDYSEKTSQNRQSFLNELSQLPYVIKYSASGGIPGQGINFAFNNLTQQNTRPGDEEKSYSMVFVDDSYFDVFEIDFLAGGPPSPAETDQGWWKNHKIIINETAAQQLGYANPVDAINQTLNYDDGYQKDKVQVSGVVRDYHHESLRDQIMAMVFGPSRNHVWFTLQLEEGETALQLNSLEELYTNHFPNNPFIYNFVEDYYHEAYEQERKLSDLISLATLLAIFISCLGLFGLATFLVQQRSKEIGIRKVLGASVGSILSLVSRDFIKLILLALIIASPIAYLIMNHWLNDFAYRIQIHWWVFLFAGLLGALIAFFTISFQGLRAAIRNPVSSLRDD
ncbi:MAG: ABC transporter permease [Saprospiraceae bacterium]|nr:ABC transporter permease [Saprospiraceae bacterium]